VITEHRILCNHDFDWEDVKILDNEPSYNKRQISEMYQKIETWVKQAEQQIPALYLPTLQLMSPT